MGCVIDVKVDDLRTQKIS